MLQRLFATASRFAPQALLGLTLAVAPLAAMLGPATPARAEPPPDPVARLQIVIKSIRILDDRDLIGSGEMSLVAGLGKCVQFQAYPCSAIPLVLDAYDFNAGSGDTVPFGRVLPLSGDTIDERSVSVETGVAVYAGEHYMLWFDMGENDPTAVKVAGCSLYAITATLADTCTIGDTMGTVVGYLDEEHGWALGSYTVRSLVQRNPRRGEDVTRPGDYEISFEVRRTPLPDLRPTSIDVLSNPGGGESVCLGVENIGQKDSGPFEMTFRLDGAEVPGGKVAGGALPVGQSGKLCLPASVPHGVHTLAVTVDEARSLPEMDEWNNVFERQIVRTAGSDASSGLPDGPGVVKPPDPLPDLVVGALRAAVNADGSGACRGDGPNYLLAEVKNVGEGSSGEFALRFAVNGSLKQERVYIQGLAANGAIQAAIPTDDLNAGSQQVRVIADGDSQVTELDEANNASETTIECG